MHLPHVLVLHNGWHHLQQHEWATAALKLVWSFCSLLKLSVPLCSINRISLHHNFCGNPSKIVMVTNLEFPVVLPTSFQKSVHIFKVIFVIDHFSRKMDV